MDLISVVIPIYNAEKYLNGCITSVINQSYVNLDIILINDGSSDSSSVICNRFCEADSRVRYFEQINSGVSAARNNGKKNARGKYIIFIDSDDILQPDMIQVLHDDIIKSNCEISVCGVNECRESNTSVMKKRWSNQVDIIDTDTALESLLLGGKIKSGAWNKLFLCDLIRNIDFIEGKRMNEDKYFCFQAIQKSSGIVYRDSGLYNYIYHEGSVVNSEFNDRWFDAIYFAELMHKECCRLNPKLEKVARSNYVSTMFYVLTLIYGNELKSSYTSEWSSYVQKIKSLRIYDITRYISYRRIVGIFSMKISTMLFELFMKISR